MKIEFPTTKNMEDWVQCGRNFTHELYHFFRFFFYFVIVFGLLWRKVFGPEKMGLEDGKSVFLILVSRPNFPSYFVACFVNSHVFGPRKSNSISIVYVSPKIKNRKENEKSCCADLYNIFWGPKNNFSLPLSKTKSLSNIQSH